MFISLPFSSIIGKNLIALFLNNSVAFVSPSPLILNLTCVHRRNCILNSNAFIKCSANVGVSKGANYIDFEISYDNKPFLIYINLLK